MADRALDSDEPLYDQAIMNCHFGTEMIMKAAIYKVGGTPPTGGADGHNLLKIAQVKVHNKKLLHGAMNRHRFILPFWHKIVGAWDTNKRYELKLIRGFTNG